MSQHACLSLSYDHLSVVPYTAKCMGFDYISLVVDEDLKSRPSWENQWKKKFTFLLVLMELVESPFVNDEAL